MYKSYVIFSEPNFSNLRIIIFNSLFIKFIDVEIFSDQTKFFEQMQEKLKVNGFDKANYKFNKFRRICWRYWVNRLKTRSGRQNLGRRNIERLIFRNFKIANIKITKDELFDRFIFEFIFHFLQIIWTPKLFNNLYIL